MGSVPACTVGLVLDRVTPVTSKLALHGMATLPVDLVLDRVTPVTSKLALHAMATLPGTWRYRVSAGTGRPNVSILWLGEIESLICSFYLSAIPSEQISS